MIAGHNRWHPDVEPLITARPGDVVSIEAPDGTRGQITRASSHSDLLTLDLSLDLLSGPVYVETAEVGDVLSVEIVDVETPDFGFTAVLPGFGFLADLIPGPYLIKWDLDGTYARSDELPGVAVPACPFPGTIGTAPSRDMVQAIREREQELANRIGVSYDAYLASPVPGRLARGLGPLPPREHGGNMDIPQLCVGSKLFLPVNVPGALLSLGDVHFAQGEGEVCGSAIEIGATVRVRIDLIKEPAVRLRNPSFETVARRARRYFATTGIPVEGVLRNEHLDLNLAARSALIDMIDHLSGTYGFSREASYALASVVVDLHISEVVDIPNALVSALLPLDVFEDPQSSA